MVKQINADFPEKLQFLFRPWRYKIARGGRGSGKSWSFARALLVKGVKAPLRVLCAREVQLSIKQSVHKLLKDQIELLGLQDYYNIFETEIRGTNGTEFAFAGLSALSIDQIKSYEGYDVCWVEEGQTISKRSWDILIPTIRKENSEIWVSYNPELETDETHQRFTLHKQENCVNVEINWRDNPWFNDVLEQERLHCKETDPDNYDHIWEGKCRPAVAGAIYAKQIQEAESLNRICKVPYDPLLKVHIVMDLGWEDAVSIGMVQKHVSQLRCFDYMEDSHRTLSDYSADLKAKRYNWGRLFLPHDGHAKRVDTGKSSADILKRLGWDVASSFETAKVSVEEGIRQTRMVFHKLYFDEDRCARWVECLKRYRRKINRQTESPGSPVHDQYSHAADMTRYLCINEQNMLNEKMQNPRQRVQYVAAGDSEVGY